MFVGHYAVAFGAKRAAPRVSLGILFAATSLIDLLWPIFLLLGWERARIEPGNTMVTPLAFVHYPWTHSLVGAAVWAALFALLYWLVTRYAGGTLVVGLVTISHWLSSVPMAAARPPCYDSSLACSTQVKLKSRWIP